MIKDARLIGLIKARTKKQDEEMAIHETGHALWMASHPLFTVNFATIDPICFGELRFEAFVSTSAVWSETNKTHLQLLCGAYIAGAAAEMMVKNKVDLQTCRRDFSQIAELSRNAMWVPDDFNEDDIPKNIVAYSEQFTIFAMTLIYEAYRQATRFFTTHRAAFNHLNRHLLKKRYLTGQEIHTLLKAHQ